MSTDTFLIIHTIPYITLGTRLTLGIRLVKLQEAQLSAADMLVF